MVDILSGSMAASSPDDMLFHMDLQGDLDCGVSRDFLLLLD